MSFQTCLACRGVGTLPAGFYTAPEGGYIASTAREQCRSCGGRGVLSKADPAPTPLPGGTTGLGKDARCSYCGGSLWVCRGSHNVCEAGSSSVSTSSPFGI